MAGCSSSKFMLLLMGMLIGTLPGLFMGFSSKYSYNIVTTIQPEKCENEETEPTTTSSHFPTNQNAAGTIRSTRKVAPSKTSRASLAHPEWCPKANCTNTDLCHPCQRRFLIVIATARSASTTLTWMLNELPGVRMSGENNNHLDMVWQMHNNLWNHSSFHRGNEKKTAWGHNYIPRQTFACAAQATVEAINPPPLLQDQKTLPDPEVEQQTIVGFKTIRFERGADRHYTEMVDLVKENFPCSKILININSNVTRQAESFRAAQFFHITPKSLQRRNDQLRHIQHLFGDERAFLIDSSKWTKNVEVLNDAVEWLGFHKSCRFQELLEFNTGGGHGFQNGKAELTHQDPLCQALQ